MNGCMPRRAISVPDNRAAGGANQNSHRNTHPGRPLPVNLKQAETDGGQRQHAAHRQIDAAGDDHQGHATGQQSVDRRLSQRVTMRPDLEEGAIGVERSLPTAAPGSGQTTHDRQVRQPAPQGGRPIFNDSRSSFTVVSPYGALPATQVAAASCRCRTAATDAPHVRKPQLSPIAASSTFSASLLRGDSAPSHDPRCMTTMRSLIANNSGISEVTSRMAIP